MHYENEMEIESSFNLKKVKFQRKYSGYIYRREIVDDSEYGGDGNLEIVSCYSAHTGHYIGDANMARYLCRKRGIRQIQKATQEHSTCSIGFNEDEQRWYGWSHRAICGFGLDDKLFEEGFGNEFTPYVQHGEKDIDTLDDAKLSAVRFAESVS